MSASQKRQANGMDASNILDGPRKRRRESAQGDSRAATNPGGSPPLKITLKLRRGGADGGAEDADIDGQQALVTSSDVDDDDEYEEPQHHAVRASEVGLEVWNAVKNAKDSSGRLMAIDFLKLPSKRMYPDYYIHIKRPISLDEIKKNLDAMSYSSPSAVKADFDTMFKNAKNYNVKDSPIWIDAKNLHNIVSARYKTLAGNMASDDDEDDSGDEYEDESPRAHATAPEKQKKAKDAAKSNAPNMLRLIKQRLQKLLKKEDSDGRLYVAAFMELPSKKEYPTYFKTIRRPMTFNMIDKKIDRKQYDSIEKFYEDVELIFNNAYTFNEEHSFVWNNAKYLQEQFRQMMSDLPPPFSIPGLVAQKVPTKVKLKVAKQESAQPAAAKIATPAAAAVAPPAPPPANQPKASSSKAPTPLSLPPTQAQLKLAKSPSLPTAAATASPSTSLKTPAPQPLRHTSSQPNITQAQPPATPSVAGPSTQPPPPAAPMTPTGAYPGYGVPGGPMPNAQALANIYYAAGYTFQMLPPPLQAQLVPPPGALPQGVGGQQPGALLPGQPAYPGGYQTAGYGYGYQQPVPQALTPTTTGAPPLPKGYTPVHTPPSLVTAIPPATSADNATATTAANSAASPILIKYINSLTLQTLPRRRQMAFSAIEGLDLRFWSMRLGAGESGIEFGLDMFVDAKATAAVYAAKVAKAKRKAKAREDSMDVDGDDESSEEESGEEDEGGDASTGDGQAQQSTLVDVEVKVNTVLIHSKVLPPPPLPRATSAAASTPTPTALPLNSLHDGSVASSTSPGSSAVHTDSTSSLSSATSAIPVNGNGKGVNGVVDGSDDEADEEKTKEQAQDSDDEDAEGEEEDVEDEPVTTSTPSKGKGKARGRPPKRVTRSRAQTNNTNRPAPNTRTRSSGKAAAAQRASESPRVPRLSKKIRALAGVTRSDPRRWEVGLALGSNIVDVRVGGAEEGETWRLFIERVL